ncbi:50S ribosomal protein L11 methyltransferase [Fructobacillus sp. M1-13]|uniref:Ribosomal protein L11 methyltransferase n=1 Tax=Fructobacillus papyriferae TaxID=2713171 RepID=A0ABS5QNR8_9LACO|nr:50S ribosomal protein L11 methyltransferase [Fructobacillus papyriferae]MBS9334746.1 50S ribosomal protein L11 methyltransferase [Fructobacillus papyriferae]MCD2158736.1 50S ribosomal protein L11 methyltransferase [Fructobacillus papyriferae]
MTTYQKVRFQVANDLQDLVISVLIELGADGVEQGDNTLTIYEDQANEGFQKRIQTYQVGLQLLVDQGLSLNPEPVLNEPLTSKAYANEWKNYYHATRVTSRFTVVPAWEDYKKEQEQEKLVVMDPDQAFGTGTHPTTSLMLQALEVVVRGGEQTIDVGTGSGVLAVAAKHLGVGDVLATDIDALSVQTAKNNLSLNPVGKDVSVIVSDLMQDVPTDFVEKGVDLVLANILADVIEPLIPQVRQVLKPGGQFLVSGIYDDVSDGIETALVAHGFTILQKMQSGTWHAFICQLKEELE